MGFGCLVQFQPLASQLEILTQIEIYLICTPPLWLWRESLSTWVQAPGNFKLWICVVGDFDFVKPTCWQFWFGSSHLVGGDFFDQILFSLNLKRTLWPVFGCRLVGWNPLEHIPPLALSCTWTRSSLICDLLQNVEITMGYRFDHHEHDHNNQFYFSTGREAGLQISSFTLRHLLRGKLRQDCLGTWWSLSRLE